MPTASNVPSAWKPPTRLSTTRRQKGEMGAGPGAAHRAQKARVDAFEHKRAIDRWRASTKVTDGMATSNSKVCIVKRQHRAEQDVQQIDIGAASSTRW